MGRDAETRIAISQRDFREVWNDHNTDAIEDIYTPEFQGHGFPLGIKVTRDQYRWLVTLFHRAFPDCQITPTEITADSEFVYADWRFSGSHTGWLGCLPPSGKHIIFTGSGRHRHSNGQVAEIWLDVEWSSLYRQLGRSYLSLFS